MDRAVLVSDTKGLVGVGFLAGATPTLPRLPFQTRRGAYPHYTGMESGHDSDSQSEEVWGECFPADYLRLKTKKGWSIMGEVKMETSDGRLPEGVCLGVSPDTRGTLPSCADPFGGTAAAAGPSTCTFTDPMPFETELKKNALFNAPTPWYDRGAARARSMQRQQPPAAGIDPFRGVQTARSPASRARPRWS